MLKQKNIEISFKDFELIKPVMQALEDAGYESPSPIQAGIIPDVLAGRDVIGQAQTGTGKTAAFALPILSTIDLKKKKPQVLVLAPTRELAIQVAESFQGYASHMKGFHVLPIYGGQDYNVQFRQLKRNPQVIVGTPGRVMDHIKRETLDLSELSTLVLDEADEMLRMGFIDDVEWILGHTPSHRQIALFSATMPKIIRKIAQKYLTDPSEVTIKMKTTTAETIRQRFWMVSGFHKLDALTRILEAETYGGIIIFVRTKNATSELAEKLEARGYAAAPLNGDISQRLREKTVEKLKAGKLDIVVATDVAARGLDVPRITHVINYDIPYDTESYVHRIGRTGRAGKTGEAILFVSPRERNLLRTIEKATKHRIERMELPSTEDINDKRVAKFMQRITDTLHEENIGFFYQLLEKYQNEHNIPALEIAAALAQMVQGDQPLLMSNKPIRQSRDDWNEDQDRGRKSKRSELKEGVERYRVEVGSRHGVKPGNIVGAIANKAGLDGELIGRIKIFDDFSLVDLPKGMPEETFEILKKVRVADQKLNISIAEGDDRYKESKSYSKGRSKTRDKRRERSGRGRR